MTILNKIANHAKSRVANDKNKVSAIDMKYSALKLAKGEFAFEEALKNSSSGIICEVKKASPSKGIISEDFPYIDIAREYEKIGATCISVLTEPKWFLGCDYIFSDIRKNVNIPMLRKDFTIDEYQIYQAKVMGADCILLICALLCEDELKQYLNICDELGISALVETHDRCEIETALKIGARIIGVNNRNLKNFSVNLDNATELKQHIPNDVIYVAESGITTPTDGIKLLQNGADALLIGEALMKSSSRRSFIDSIKGYGNG